MEWIFTALFTLEYIARLLCVRRPWQYAWSFYGVVDLVAILPSFINLFTSANYVMVIRVLRLLRVFRVLKLAHFLEETDTLVTALRASRRKIMVFIFTVLAVVIVMGTLMYLIEGEANGFTSIPYGIYWAIVTLTTVGYGDITPHTRARPIHGQPHHDHGLRHYRRADRHLFDGTAPGGEGERGAGLRELRDGRIGSRRAFLSPLRQTVRLRSPRSSRAD